MSVIHHLTCSRLSVAPLPPARSDGPARLPVLLAGEPRRLVPAPAGASAPVQVENRRSEFHPKTKAR